VLEGVLEKRIREKVKVDNMQFGFTSGKGTTDAIFVVQKFRSKRFCGFGESLRQSTQRDSSLGAA
jgi:hypothetical protein